MIRNLKTGIFVYVFMSVMPTTAGATGDLTDQKPVVINISLGNKQNELVFKPDNLLFETGKLYKLVIYNPSKQKHYFTSEALARSVFTRKVQLLNHALQSIAEVKGFVHEIEVYPGGTAEWWFVPVKTIAHARLHCSIKGHSEAGMTGRIKIK